MIQGSNRGITIIEVLAAASILIVVMWVVILFVARVYELPKFQFEQGRITTTALIQIERMSDLIRKGGVSEKGWNSITAGGVRYWLVEDKLMRQESGGGAQVVARGIQNLYQTPVVNMFDYYSIGGPKALRLNTTPTSGPLARVTITLVVDTDEDQLPDEATVKTEVFLRQ